MLFNSIEFIVFFLPFTLLAFYLLKSYGFHTYSTGMLVVSSLFFYGWWNPHYLTLIVFSILFNYSIGCKISSSDVKKVRKTLLIGGIAINLFLIAYFKYVDFFISSINAVVNEDYSLLGIILPIAISFFTFQQISFLIDAYSGKTKDYNFLHYCLFVTFFPQLIAGPIVHHREIIPQYEELHKKKVVYQNIALGLFIFSIGLFKKVIIADNLGLYANPVFITAETGTPVSFIVAWQGVLAYTFQIYFDFSGYSDMAVGLAKMFGLNLPVNFYSPYKAKSFVEFWRRWHITLSRFFRDYVYIPLGGNRKGVFRQLLYLNITMFLCGLWHGAGWTFVLWGSLHGIFLTINHIFRNTILVLKLTAYLDNFIFNTFFHILTFICIVFSWALFRADSIDGAVNIVSGLVRINGVIFPETYALYFAKLGITLDYFDVQFVEALPNFDGIVIFSVFLLLFFACKLLPSTSEISNYYSFLENRENLIKKNRMSFISWRPSKFWMLYTGIIFSMAITYIWMGLYSDFLYFQF